MKIVRCIPAYNLHTKLTNARGDMSYNVKIFPSINGLDGTHSIHVFLHQSTFALAWPHIN